MVYLIADESDVLHLFNTGDTRRTPDAVAFDVHADKVPIRKQPGHTQRIFPFAAGQLHYDGVRILKKFTVPFALQHRTFFKHDGVIRQFCEFLQFGFGSHLVLLDKNTNLSDSINRKNGNGSVCFRQ